MQPAALATTPTFRSPRNNVPTEGPLRLRFDAILQERDALHEEVRQLRAAVQIYTEVVRRLQVSVPQRAI